MQGSNLTITVETKGIAEAEARLNGLGATMTKLTEKQNGTVRATGVVSGALDTQRKSTDAVAGATNRASKAQEGYFGHIARTTIQSALINKLFLELVDVSGQAVKQVDLMNNFPATMASMGESTGDASAAMQALRDYVGQVGGNLGDATSYVTRFTGATKDVKAATAIFVGLNNALIAGDSSMEEQKQAAVQFAQALERGRPDLREWRTLTQNMSFQLTQVAKSMGYVNANELGEALTQGEESMAAFTTALTKMATGTGPIAQQAMARMNGMQFAFNVLKNTLVQGLAAIIDTIGRQNIVSFFNFLTQVIQVLTRVVVVLIGWIVTLLNLLGGLFGLPAIKLKNDTEGVAESLSSGAGSAEELSDGIGDAGKGAKKLNKELKKGLASFDKMNVLAEKTPTSSSGGGGAGDGAGGAGGSPFDSGQLGKLGDIFDNLGGGLQEASKWAKIFAGILTGLAANSLIRRIFGVNPIKLFIRYLLLALANTIFVTAQIVARFAWAGAQAVGTFGAAIGRGLLGKGSGGSGILGEAAALGARIGLAVRAGFITVFSGIGGAIRTVLFSPLAGVGRLLATAIIGVIGGVAAALGVSFAVAAGIVAVAVVAIIAVIWLIWTNWETIWGFIKTVFFTTWQFIVTLWNTLFSIFKGPVLLLWKFWSSVFILIVAIVATALELMFKLVVGTIKLIFAVLASIAGWIYNNVILPVANFFVALWQGIVNAVKTAWTFIFDKILRPVAGWINNNVIQPIFRFFKGLWGSVLGFVTGAISKIKNFLSPLGSWIKSNIIDKIANFFSGLWDGVKNGLSNMINGLKRLFGNIGNVFKTPINGIIDILNKVLRSLNENVKVPDWVPGLGGKSPNFPMIPKLASGGVVDKATLAMIGEGGSEVVMPLENNTQWIDKLAAKINGPSQANRDADIIPVTNKQQQPKNDITIHVSGVFATSTAEQKKVAELIAKQLNLSLKAKGQQGAF